MSSERLATIAKVLGEIRKARFATGVTCPRCMSTRVIRWGAFGARQRYRCRACVRTFSDLTRSPAAYLKKIDLLPQYTACLRRTLSVRRAAQATGVAPSTAFRWRHRFAGSLAASRARTLHGWVELTTFRLPESQKGSRALSRASRRHGIGYGQPRCDLVSVVIAVDRTANVVGVVVATRTIEANDLAAVGWAVARPAVVVARDGPLGAAALFAKRSGFAYRHACASPAGREAAGDDRARAYALRFRRWLRRFRGVATRYLPNYLAWHRALDLIARQGVEGGSLGWPIPRVSVTNKSREQNGRAEPRDRPAGAGSGSSP